MISVKWHNAGLIEKRQNSVKYEHWTLLPTGQAANYTPLAKEENNVF